MGYIAVIGAGSWGTTIACLLAEKGYNTSLWVYEQGLAEEIHETRTNSVYLPGILLPDILKVSNKLDRVVQKARYVINAVPSQHTRQVFNEAARHISKDAVIVSLSKGIERKSLFTVSAVLKEITSRPAAVLSGPTFAKEVIKKLPTAVTLAIESESAGLLLQEVFNTSHFRVYTHRDVLGVELGGSLKNVMAIASGISDGLGLGNNARAAMITRGLSEIVKLGAAMGADPRTFAGLSGLGDLVLTCSSPMSRNYTVGQQLSQGVKLNDIVSGRTVAEGIATAESAYELSKKYSVEMPIVEQVYRVIYENKPPQDAVRTLMDRSLKTEFL